MGVKNRFLEIRLKLGYKKQIDFANLLGLTRSKYNRFENNKDQPNAENLLMAARKLNLKMEDIIYYEDDLEPRD